MSNKKADPTTPRPDIVGIASRVESPYQSGEFALTLEDLRDVERLGQRVSYSRYYPRLIYDIRVKEWTKGVPNLLTVATSNPTPSELDTEDREVRQAVARVWCPTAPDQVLITLSIRTMIDCLLRTLALPEGSEVLFSGISIPHMVDIVQYHKLVPVAFDIDLVHFAPDVEQCRRIVRKGVTKIMILAPLFGRPMKHIPELLEIAKENDILTIIDGAQSFSISDIINTYDADIRTVSFGSIKFSTAFGGAVTYFKSRDLAARVSAVEASLPRRSVGTHIKQMAKYLGLLLVDDPRSFALLRNILEGTGTHIGEFVNKASRGFPGALIPSLRNRPATEMIRLLHYRLTHVDLARRERVCQSAWDVLSKLPSYVQVVSAGDPNVPRESTFWLFCLNCRHPKAVTAILQAQGFDAALGTSQMRAVPGRSGEICKESEELMQHIVYVPVYPEIGEEQRKYLISVFHRIPQRAVESPSKRFHEHVAATPLRHAYRSSEVDTLLKDRKPFTELPFAILNSLLLGPIGTAATLTVMSKI